MRSLRGKAFIREIRKSFLAVRERLDFRLLEYSFQTNHVHLIVEADDHQALGRGMISISSRIARAAQRVYRLTGRVISSGYHARRLKTPREVYRAIVYVLLNARKHWRQRHRSDPPRVCLDEASSARWFEGFSRALPADRSGESEVSRARSWLGRVGWRWYGRIDPGWVPGVG